MYFFVNKKSDNYKKQKNKSLLTAGKRKFENLIRLPYRAIFHCLSSLQLVHFKYIQNEEILSVD